MVDKMLDSSVDGFQRCLILKIRKTTETLDNILDNGKETCKWKAAFQRRDITRLNPTDALKAIIDAR
ncbi:unnamed protein product [Parnassius apollo]|uniref:(apollo) hypothetical protein n=1 Tax=Parnassius apollo TaxID=110799 RepID=A0A8S3XYV3_PARAO|nr:unnamed protein product [Parnassius apollo]